MFFHEFIFSVENAVIFLLAFSLEKGTDIDGQNSFIDLALLNEHQIQQIFERDDVVNLEQALPFMHF